MLNRWDTLFLIITTVPIMGHVGILPLIYDVTGRDSWLYALLSFPLGLGIIVVIYRLRRKYPQQEIAHIAEHTLGRLLGKALVMLIVVYLLFLASFSAAILADMVHIAFMPETPVWALVIWFWLFCLYAASKGSKIIAWGATFVGLFAVFTGHSISFIDMTEKNVQHILPILEFGWTPVLWGTIVLMSVWPS